MPIQSQQTQQAQIRRQLEYLGSQFRKQEEEYMGCDENDPCDFTGECQNVAPLLAEFLKKNGFSNARKVGGYYMDVSPEYDPQSDDMQDFNPINSDRSYWKHWWVETNNMIVDITSDQFHPPPEQSELYRVIVTPMGDWRYQYPKTTNMRVPMRCPSNYIFDKKESICIPKNKI